MRYLNNAEKKIIKELRPITIADRRDKIITKPFELLGSKKRERLEDKRERNRNGGSSKGKKKNTKERMWRKSIGNFYLI